MSLALGPGGFNAGKQLGRNSATEMGMFALRGFIVGCGCQNQWDPILG